MLEIKYGDNYVIVDENPRVSGSLIGGVFAGTWEMLEDCFGITAETINQWCLDNGYHYSVKKFNPADEMINSLYKLRRELEDFGTIQELTAIIETYEKATN